MRRSLAVVALAFSLAACSAAEQAAEVLSPSASASSPVATPSPSSTATAGASGTSAATGSSGPRPAIVVQTPKPGDEIVSPVTVSGSANVFEATVAIVILDRDGQQLAATFATASCGSGCRGTYSADVAFYVQERQAATIRVFEESAEDGSAINVVEVVVVLVPGA